MELSRNMNLVVAVIAVKAVDYLSGGIPENGRLNIIATLSKRIQLVIQPEFCEDFILISIK